MSLMTAANSETQLRAVLRRVLDDAVQMVPEPARTSSLKACLAEKILNLAAGGETNPKTLTRLAVRLIQDSCPSCSGCEGWRPALTARKRTDHPHAAHPLSSD